MPTYIDIHVLHTYPFVNLNRDDTGAPKTAVFGGVNRVRISSQALKRPTRLWAETEGLMTSSVRTRHIHDLIRERLDDGPLPEQDRDNAALIVANAVKGLSGKEGGKDVLGFFGETEINGFVELANSVTDAGSLKPGKGKKGDATKTAEDGVKESVDKIVGNAESAVAMFGRMFANRDDLRVDGAVQVAHALTVHGASIEQDYFTAVEDWKSIDDDTSAGAGHLDTNEYGGGTFYKYANIGIDELLRNVGSDTEAAQKLIAAFIQGFLLSSPTGKKTTTAGAGIPDLVYIAVQQRMPLNLSAAFEEPVKGRNGFRAPAIEALSKHTKAVHEFTGTRPLHAGHATTLDVAADGLGDNVAGIDALVSLALKALPSNG